jgi:ribonuclease HI
MSSTYSSRIDDFLHLNPAHPAPSHHSPPTEVTKAIGGPFDHYALITQCPHTCLPTAEANPVEKGNQTPPNQPTRFVYPICKQDLESTTLKIQATLGPRIHALARQIQSAQHTLLSPLDSNHTSAAITAMKNSPSYSAPDVNPLANSLQDLLLEALSIMQSVCKTAPPRTQKIHLSRSQRRKRDALQLESAELTQLLHELDETGSLRRTPSHHVHLPDDVTREQLQELAQTAKDKLRAANICAAEQARLKAREAAQARIATQPRAAFKSIFNPTTHQDTKPLSALRDPTNKGRVHTSTEGMISAAQTFFTKLLAPEAPRGPTPPDTTNTIYPWARPDAVDSFTLSKGTEHHPDGPQERDPECTDLLDHILDKCAYQAQLRRAAKNKAPGPDEIPNELLAALPQPWHDAIQALFSICWVTGTTPLAWSQSTTILLYKKGDATELSNYRPIGLSNALYKLWTANMTTAITNYAMQAGILHNTQEGGLPGRNTHRQIRNLLNAIEDAYLTKRDIYCLFVDFSAAFNMVSHHKLWNVMSDLGIPKDAVSAVQGVYQHNTTSISLPMGNTPPITITRGTIQGDPLSPLLFLLYVEPLLRWLTVGGRGYEYGCLQTEPHHNTPTTTRMACAGYVDDTTALTNTRENMEAQAHKIAAYSEWAEIPVNQSKCAVTAALHGSSPSDPYNNTKIARRLSGTFALRITGDTIPFIPPGKPYKYLGLQVALNMDWRPQLRVTIEEATRKATLLAGSMASERQRLRAITERIRPAMAYALGAAAFTTTDIETMDRCLAQAARRSLNLPRGYQTAALIRPTEAGGWGIPSLTTDYAQVSAANLARTLNDPGRLGKISAALLQLQATRMGEAPIAELNTTDARHCTLFRQQRIAAKRNLYVTVDGKTLHLRTDPARPPAEQYHPLWSLANQDLDDPITTRHLAPLHSVGVRNLGQLTSVSGTHMITPSELQRLVDGRQVQASQRRALNRLTLLLCKPQNLEPTQPPSPAPPSAPAPQTARPPKVLGEDLPPTMRALPTNLRLSPQRPAWAQPASLAGVSKLHTIPSQAPRDAARWNTSSHPSATQPGGNQGTPNSDPNPEGPTQKKQKRASSKAMATALRNRRCQQETAAQKKQRHTISCPARGTTLPYWDLALAHMRKQFKQRGDALANQLHENFWMEVGRVTNLPNPRTQCDSNTFRHAVSCMSEITNDLFSQLYNNTFTITAVTGVLTQKTNTAAPATASYFCQYTPTLMLKAHVATAQRMYPEHVERTEDLDPSDPFTSPEEESHVQDLAGPQSAPDPSLFTRVHWTPYPDTLKSWQASYPATFPVLLELYKGQKPTEAQPLPPPPPNDTHLDNSVRQGADTPTAPLVWSSNAERREAMTRITIDPAECNPDADIEPTGQHRLQRGSRLKGESQSSNTDSVYTYDPNGRCVGTLTIAALESLHAQYTATCDKPPHTPTRNPFEQEVANFLARNQVPKHQIKEADRDGWALTEATMKPLSDILGIQAERFASPLDRSPHIPDYWSAHPADSVFGARHDAFSEVWTGCSVAHPGANPTLTEKATRWAIASTAAPAPTCTILVLPEVTTAAHMQYLRHPTVTHLTKIRSATLRHRLHHTSPDPDVTPFPKHTWLLVVAVCNTGGLSEYLTTEKRAALLRAWGTHDGALAFPPLPSQSPLVLPPRRLATLMTTECATPRTQSTPHPLAVPAATRTYLRDLMTEDAHLPLAAPVDGTVVYTDGSFMPPGKDAGPGKIGSAAVFITLGETGPTESGGWGYPNPTTHTDELNPAAEAAYLNKITRAELVPILHALTHAPSETPLTVYTDSLCSIHLIKRICTNPRTLTGAKHWPMLLRIAEALRHRALSGSHTHIRKVKSHSGITGNEAADVAAVHAAKNPEEISIPRAHEKDNPYGAGAWVAIGRLPRTRRTTNPEEKSAPQPTSYAPASNLTSALNKEALKTGALGTFATTGVYATAMQAARPTIDPQASRGMFKDPAITWRQLKLSMKALWGHLYNNKLAYRYGLSPTPNCPLCGEPDSTGHMLGGCKASEHLYIARHDAAVRTLLKSLQKGPMQGRYTAIDACQLDQLADLGAQTKRPPNFLFRAEDVEEGGRLRPDLLFVADLTAGTPTNNPEISAPPRQRTVHIVEIGYSADLQLVEKHRTKTTQHARLQELLTKAGHTVHYHPVALGTCGSIHTSLEKALTSKGLGDQTQAQAQKCARKLQRNAVQWLEKIYNARAIRSGMGNTQVPPASQPHQDQQHQDHHQPGPHQDHHHRDPSQGPAPQGRRGKHKATTTTEELRRRSAASSRPGIETGQSSTYPPDKLPTRCR